MYILFVAFVVVKGISIIVQNSERITLKRNVLGVAPKKGGFKIKL